MMKLYYSPGTVALAAHIALEEVGADYEAIRLDFAAGQQQSPEYLSINAKGRVPALVTVRGTLTEVPAVLAYIAQTHQAPRLAPADPFEFAKLQEFNTYLCSTVHVAHAHKMRGTRWADDPAAIEHMKSKVPEKMGAAFDLIEDGMLKGEWVLGESYSVCDAYLYTVARWLDGDGVPAERHPRVRAHMARMAERPAVQAALGAQGLT